MLGRRVAIVMTAALLALSAGAVAAFADNGVSVSPSAGVPSDLVSVTSDFGGDGSTCQIDWDGNEVQAQGSCGADGVPVVVTASGTPGTHTVSVCDPLCDESAASGAAAFVIDAVVPQVSGFAVPDADALLTSAGLATVAPDTSGTLVTGSLPTAGATVPPAQAVQLLVSPAAVGPPDGVNHDSTTVDSSTVSTHVHSTVGDSTPPTSSTTTPLVAVAHSGGFPWLGGWLAVAVAALAVALWWLRRRGSHRLARHTGFRAPPRVTVTAHGGRAHVRVEGGRPAVSFDVRSRSISTTTLTFGDRHDR